jgi:hypothetical protein
MAPAPISGSPSQADTPMTDANDDVVPSIPVDAPADAPMLVRAVSCFLHLTVHRNLRSDLSAWQFMYAGTR